MMLPVMTPGGGGGGGGGPRRRPGLGCRRTNSSIVACGCIPSFRGPPNTGPRRTAASPSWQSSCSIRANAALPEAPVVGGRMPTCSYAAILSTPASPSQSPTSDPPGAVSPMMDGSGTRPPFNQTDASEPDDEAIPAGVVGFLSADGRRPGLENRVAAAAGAALARIKSDSSCARAT